MARPRSEEARNAAIEATTALLLAEGIEAVTFEEVACRSGVAKTTLYRHFGSKQGLILAATASCAVDSPTPDTGDLAKDLRTISRHILATKPERSMDVLPVLMAVSDRDPEVQEMVRATLAHRHQPIRTVLQLAQLRGEISRALDLDFAVNLVVGPMLMRAAIDGHVLDETFCFAVIDTVVAGLRATADAGDVVAASGASSSI